MAFCAFCGVEVESGHQTCPLCLRRLDESSLAPLAGDQAYARDREQVQTPQDLQKRRLSIVVAVLSGLVVVPALICVLVDLFYQGNGWSHFVVASLALVWCLGFTPRLFFGKPLVVLLADVGLVAVYLLSLDLLAGYSAWSLRLGLPILAGAGLMVVLNWLALRLYQRHTGFVLATFFGSSAIACLVIDAAVSRWSKGHFDLLWSLITLAALLALTLLAVVMQLVYFRSKSIQRYLHW